MTKKEWLELYSSLEVEIPPGTPEGVMPTPSSIAEYEAATGFKLPAAYCEFIQIFGPGELGRMFRIRAPGYPQLDGSIDLGIFNSGLDSLRNNPQDPPEMREQMERLHFFAATDNGEAIAWDPHYRNTDQHDCRIYILLRCHSGLELLSASFESFISDVCLGDGYFRFFTNETHWNTEAMGNQRTFSPWIDAAS